MNSFNINFLGKKNKKDANNEFPIYCRMSMNGKRIEIFTKRYIKSKDWDRNRRRAHPRTKKLREFNLYMENFSSRIFQHYQKLLALEEPFTLKQLKQSILFNGKQSYTLLDAIIDHNDEMERQIPKNFAAGTLKNYKTLNKHVIKYFLTTSDDKTDSIRKVDISFIYRFESFLYTNTECNRNGAVKVLQMLKKILTQARRKGHLKNDPFDGYSFKLEKKEITYLNEHEFELVRNVELNKRLNYVRDLFVFCVYTSLSYGDLMKLDENQIFINSKGTLYLHNKRKKTGVPFIIPLLPPALEILEKYRGKNEDSIFRYMTNQKVNKFLKEIMELAGVKKRITFHMARHTFGTTIAINNGMRIESISKIMGHSKIRTTQIYAKIQEKSISEDMEILSQKLFNK